jgi:hypothetical protein
MIGAPSEIVKAIDFEFENTLPEATTVLVNAPFLDGEPVISPVVELMERPAGSPEALHDETGLFSLSVNSGVLENATPTFPEKLCPLVMMGAPAIIKISTCSESAPPGPVAVMVGLNSPTLVGVPVIAPVLELIESPAGSPVALQLVTGRFPLSSTENVQLNGDP